MPRSEEGVWRLTDTPEPSGPPSSTMSTYEFRDTIDRNRDRVPRRVRVPDDGRDFQIGNDTLTVMTLSLRHAPTYDRVLRAASNFFRRHHDGRYSDSTIMRLITAGEQVSTMRSDAIRTSRQPRGRVINEPPVLQVVERPFTYDEDTEIKSGGLLGLAVTWLDTGRTVIAVHQEFRRQRIGTNLMRQVLRTCHQPQLWVGRNNLGGHHFALATSLYPTAMNASGALRYALGGDDDDL